MSNQHIMSRKHLKLIWATAEDAVMNSCFYCKKCEKWISFTGFTTNVRRKVFEVLIRRLSVGRSCIEEKINVLK